MGYLGHKRLIALVALFVVSGSCGGVLSDGTSTLTSGPLAISSPWRGIGVADDPVECPDVTSLDVSWYYNWWHETTCGDNDAEFVAMVWGDECATVETCRAVLGQSTVKLPRPSVLLGFNEPDLATQANMTVGRAIELWPALESTGLSLGSPATTWTDSGRVWTDSFMTQVGQLGHRVDFIAMHWYGPCSDIEGLMTAVDHYRRYQRPIWITEFSCLGGTVSETSNFISQSMTRLAEDPDVERVSWFSTRPYASAERYGALHTSDGRQNLAGLAYAAIEPCRRSLRASPC